MHAFLRGTDDHVLRVTDTAGARRVGVPSADHYELQSPDSTPRCGVRADCWFPRRTP